MRNTKLSRRRFMAAPGLGAAAPWGGGGGVVGAGRAARGRWGWRRGGPRRTGQALALTVALLLTVDMGLSAAALLRMEERSRGLTASNTVEQALDVWYTDAKLEHRYRNMQLPGQVLVF